MYAAINVVGLYPGLISGAGDGQKRQVYDICFDVGLFCENQISWQGALLAVLYHMSATLSEC